MKQKLFQTPMPKKTNNCKIGDLVRFILFNEELDNTFGIYLGPNKNKSYVERYSIIYSQVLATNLNCVLLHEYEKVKL